MMPTVKHTNFPCDLCGADRPVEVPHSREYTGDQPVYICSQCGFVYVRSRRSAKDIAASWSDDIFGEGYTARIPAVTARLTFVAAFLDEQIGLKGKTLCDIGGGEGEFLRIAGGQPYGARTFGIEPSPANCARLRELGVEHFNGTIEDYRDRPDGQKRRFDVVTIMWTLENCQSCRAMLDAAHDVLADGGHILVATGSRLLVPFKKPLHYYLSKNPADTHCFRFSANSLRGILAVSGFAPVAINRYVDQDWLVVVARKEAKGKSIPWQGDDPKAMSDFFERWHRDTQTHFRDI